ncbi:MAG: MFS transporter [Bacteroidales bacterium]
MLNKILDFYKISKPTQTLSDPEEIKKRFKYCQWATFLAATLGYGIYYVCRLGLNVVKKPMVDEGIFSTAELGIIGSVFYITYAIGKFTNGFIADRSNVGRFITSGLMVTALVNLVLGYANSFLLFTVLWGISGYFQSVGAPCCVVSLSRWYADDNRGTFYGFWTSAHNFGEAITFIVIAAVVSIWGWKSGFMSAGIIGLAGVLLLWKFYYDTPQSQGLPPVKTADNENPKKAETSAEINKAQKKVLLMPAIWILALASAFMYMSRYAVNSWGMFYLEEQKGYDTMTAGLIISISSVCGVIGAVFSGYISDRFFNGCRNFIALASGVLDTIALCLFLLVPGNHFWVDALAMFMFGTGIGVLICFLGGLMAVDIAPKNASGAALGVVGIASYIGAALQDVMSGMLIEGHKTVIDGNTVYDFTYINWFWIGSAAVSTLLATLVWKKERAPEAEVEISEVTA